MPLGWQVSVRESTAAGSRTSHASGWLLVLPGCCVGNDGINALAAKPTQFSFPLCCFFPAVSSKSYVVTIVLNIHSKFTPFCQLGVISHTCARVLMLNGLTNIIYTIVSR